MHNIKSRWQVPRKWKALDDERKGKEWVGFRFRLLETLSYGNFGTCQLMRIAHTRERVFVCVIVQLCFGENPYFPFKLSKQNSKLKNWLWLPSTTLEYQCSVSWFEYMYASCTQYICKASSVNLICIPYTWETGYPSFKININQWCLYAGWVPQGIL
jgi:hypothetical protein